jgi:hypothetical protein
MSANRFRAAADLTYHLGQALRHATQVEAYLTHGIDTTDALLMLATDVEHAVQALTDYRNAAIKKESTTDANPAQ